MSSDRSWRQMTLREAGVTLIDCDHRTPPAAEDGYPYIAIPQLKNGHINLDGVRRISENDFHEWTRKLKPQPDDVIVVRRCNSGDSAVIPKGLQCAIGQNLVVLRADGKRVLPTYLRWLVRGSEWWDQVRKFINVGAVFDSLKCREIPEFQLRIPPLAAQQQIVDVLGSIDDRITLLRETNVTLESIAQALFKSWFVDFDPVRAKAEGREPEGLSAEVVRLFPDSFEDVEFGSIPTGWRAGVLGDLSQTAREQRQPSDLDDKTHYVGLEHIPRRSLSLTDWGNAGTLESAKSCFKEGDILFGKLRPYFHKVVVAPFDGVCSTDVLVCRPKEPAFYGLVAMHLSSKPLVDYADRLSNGAKMPRVNWKDLAAYPIAVPPEPIADYFRVATEPLIQSIVANVLKAKTLADLRDALLPRLISGQLRLNEAESLLQDAA